MTCATLRVTLGYHLLERRRRHRAGERAARMLAREELVGGERERVLIAPRVDLVARELLGRHVARRPEDVTVPGSGSSCWARAASRGRSRGPSRRRRRTTITFDGFTSRWMTPALCAAASARATSTQPARASARAARGRRPRTCRSGAPVDELHHDVEDALGLADVVDGDRVRMSERRRRRAPRGRGARRPRRRSRSGRSTLSATLRRSRVSSAR